MIHEFVVNGIALGSIFVLGAVGLSLIYGVRNFANFAHGDILTLGAYLAFTVNVIFAWNWVSVAPSMSVAAVLLGIAAVGLAGALGLRLFFRVRGAPPSPRRRGLPLLFLLVGILALGASLPMLNLVRLGISEVAVPTGLLLSGVTAIIGAGLAGVLFEHSIFRPLQYRGPIPSLIASIGLAFILQNVISALYGTDQRFFSVSSGVGIDVGAGIVLTMVKQYTIIIGVLLVVVLHLVLRYTKLGKAMRATSDDLDLARVTGINVRWVIIWTWVIGAGFAAIGGILLGLNAQVKPLMGFGILLFIFAAVILGGIGSAYGALLGGFVIGITNEVSKAFLFRAGFDAAWSPAFPFAIMVTMLLIRPEGLLGGEPLFRWGVLRASLSRFARRIRGLRAPSR
ncbi:MAG: branched-chain amino acid ABC transporter permease [Thermoplasmata archaeon]